MDRATVARRRGRRRRSAGSWPDGAGRLTLSPLDERSVGIGDDRRNGVGVFGDVERRAVEVLPRRHALFDGTLLRGEQRAGVVRRLRYTPVEALDPPADPAPQAEVATPVPAAPTVVVGEFAVLGDDRPKPSAAEVVGALHPADATRLRFADGRLRRSSCGADSVGSAVGDAA